jgi:hypothetical protein
MPGPEKTMTFSDRQARENWGERAAFRRIYFFFGRPIEFLTDSEPEFSDFDTIYRRFQKSPEPASLKEIKPLFLLRDPKNSGYLIYLNNQLFQVPSPANRVELYMFLFNSLLDRTEDLFIVHGAALADQDQGLIMAAPSGGGKSTLTLELLARGKSFLSDELALISVRDGRLQAFPRALAVGRENLKNVLSRRGEKFENFKPALEHQGRVMFDVEELFPGQIAAQCRLRKIVFIEPPPLTGSETRRNLLEIGLTALPEGLRQALLAIPEISHLDQIQTLPYPILRLTSQAETTLMARIQEVAVQQGVGIRSYYPEGKEGVDYLAAPALIELKPLSGVTTLLRYILNIPALTRSNTSSSGGRQQLLFRLAQATRGVRFYRLTPGILSQMTDLIDGPSARLS